MFALLFLFEILKDLPIQIILVTFLSILDLARNNEIKIEQENNFSDIYLLGGTI